MLFSSGEENLRRCQSLALVWAWPVQVQVSLDSAGPGPVCPDERAESQYGVRATQAGSLSDPFTGGERGLAR